MSVTHLLALLTSPKLPVTCGAIDNVKAPNFFLIEEYASLILMLFRLGCLVTLVGGEFLVSTCLAGLTIVPTLFTYHRLSRFLSEQEMTWAKALFSHVGLEPPKPYMRRIEFAQAIDSINHKFYSPLTDQGN